MSNASLRHWVSMLLSEDLDNQTEINLRGRIREELGKKVGNNTSMQIVIKHGKEETVLWTK